MSNLNIKRTIENIKTGKTTVYTPVIEVIVNAIQAIKSKQEEHGEITIIAKRSPQFELEEGSLPSIESFEITDNGIGFTDEHRESFDTLYTDKKITEGGKGFGRFTCLKYFKNLNVESVYNDGNGFKKRTFCMGRDNDIIINEKIEALENKNISSTTVKLLLVKDNKFLDKKLETIAKNLVEKLLPYFVSENFTCPKIIISDENDSITLNEYINHSLNGIQEIKINNNNFSLNGIASEYDFIVRVFKFYSPKSQKSRISLVAHQREVTANAIHNYIPEFIKEFYELDGNRNYIIKAYVFGDYLDNNVSLERGGFEFQKDNDILLGISQSQIELAALALAKQAVVNDITDRQEKKKQRISAYVEVQAPWYKGVVDKIDLSKIKYKPTDEDIDSALHKEKYQQESSIKKEVTKLLADGDIESIKANVANIVSKISETGKNELTHYIALRRDVLNIFKKSLEINSDGKYSSEGIVHDIIFPRKGDSEITSFEDHNLWIIDERLNFSTYVSSDLPLNGAKSDRPDLLVYNHRVSFREANEPSNPITIFEFKKPQRDDFVNPSSDEDPVQQIVRYVNKIRNGDFKTPKGHRIKIEKTTPFYGYVVCDITKKIEQWLEVEKNFKPMPDKLGWFYWHDSINLYMEVLSWEKVLQDAEMRSRIFFHKLGID